MSLFSLNTAEIPKWWPNLKKKNPSLTMCLPLSTDTCTVLEFPHLNSFLSTGTLSTDHWVKTKPSILRESNVKQYFGTHLKEKLNSLTKYWLTQCVFHSQCPNSSAASLWETCQVDRAFPCTRACSEANMEFFFFSLCSEWWLAREEEGDCGVGCSACGRQSVLHVGWNWEASYKNWCSLGGLSVLVVWNFYWINETKMQFRLVNFDMEQMATIISP